MQNILSIEVEQGEMPKREPSDAMKLYNRVADLRKNEWLSVEFSSWMVKRAHVAGLRVKFARTKTHKLVVHSMSKTKVNLWVEKRKTGEEWTPQRTVNRATDWVEAR